MSLPQTACACEQVTEQMLSAFGVHTVADLHARRAALRHVFSPISCEFFWHAYLGLGSTMTPEKASEGDVTRKGISCERTFAPISQREDLEAKVRDLAEHLAGDMADESIAGKCVTLKLKETTFQVCHTCNTFVHALPTPVALRCVVCMRYLTSACQ